ncbi:YutD family protein [Paenibacillus sp. 1P07SE]|uniref:YutD family protein n=1 Tax=Paenibacillus sp. 1P07SE TaxID=3132209 RepID=UPI0039A5720D
MIHIGGRTFELVHEHKTAWNAEAFRDRYSDVLERYDFIIGDWGYGQLRLKGFFRDSHPKATKDSSFSFMSDYINEYCNFGCAYFVLQKSATSKKSDPSQDYGPEPEHHETEPAGEPADAGLPMTEQEPVVAAQEPAPLLPRNQRPYKSRNRGSRSGGKPRSSDARHHESKGADVKAEMRGGESKGAGRAGDGRGQQSAAVSGKAGEGKKREGTPPGARAGGGKPS